MKTYSWEDVHKHDSEDDCWMVIKGKVYNVTSWVPRHPGGSNIMQGAGRDATPLFISYHPLKIEAMLEKYCIGELNNYSPYYKWESEFYTTMKKRVEALIKQKNLNNDAWTMYLKTVLVVISFVLTYYLALIRGSIFWTFVFGFVASHIGISIGHDACHGSYSKNRTINRALSAALDMIGGSWFVWSMQHNVGHHPHSNRQGDYEDEDFDPDSRSGFPLLRLTPHFEWKPRFQYQHLYVWLLFPFVGIKWIYGDLKYVSSMRYQTMKFWKANYPVLTYQLFTKLFFFSYCYFTPVYLHGFIYGTILTCIMFAIFSYNFSLNFAVNHLTDECLFPDENFPQERDWAKLQVMVTSNYAVNSTFWTIFSGGLNHQIEHHLFPGLCHVYLPYVKPIVKRTCEEYGVPYVCFPDYWTAILSYYQHLKTLGKKPETKKN
jgi:fatty acid desaturase